MSMILAAAKNIRIASHILIRSNLVLHHVFSSNPNSQNSDLKTHDFKVSDYLISSFGFSPVKAAAISKRISHLKSPDKPQAVFHFLEHHGFDEPQRKTIVSGCPDILCSSVENTLAPNLRALHNVGLSSSAVNQIILSSPTALQRSEAVPRINYWRDFVGGDEATLVKVFKRNRNLICLDINGGIATKISLFKSYGLSADEIRMIICMTGQLITSSVSAIADKLKRVKELGFQPGSRMFVFGLHGLNGISREMLQKKKELFTSLGWSEDEFLSAVQKFPTMMSLSEENLRAKMDFLLGEVRCDISYITSRPILLGFCLEKRLRPRYCVLQLLVSNNLFKKRRDFLCAIKLTESKFVELYILPHTDSIPDLDEAHVAASTSAS